MQVFVGIDDKNVAGVDRGPGKASRRIERELPQNVRRHGIVHPQLPMGSTGFGT